MLSQCRPRQTSSHYKIRHPTTPNNTTCLEPGRAVPGTGALKLEPSQPPQIPPERTSQQPAISAGNARPDFQTLAWGHKEPRAIRRIQAHPPFTKLSSIKGAFRETTATRQRTRRIPASQNNEPSGKRSSHHPCLLFSQGVTGPLLSR